MPNPRPAVEWAEHLVQQVKDYPPLGHAAWDEAYKTEVVKALDAYARQQVAADRIAHPCPPEHRPPPPKHHSWYDYAKFLEENRSQQMEEALKRIKKSLEAASEERLQELKKWERESERWMANGDMYGWNFHQGGWRELVRHPLSAGRTRDRRDPGLTP